jgi:ASC-1-like (ASCH) protein
MSTIKNYHIAEPHFSFIKSGDKKYEGRPLESRIITENIKDNNIIDTNEEIIIWTGPNNNDFNSRIDQFNVKIIDFKGYNSIMDMLLDIELIRILPNATSIGDAYNIYSDLRIKSGKDQDGPMIALEFKLCNL